MIFLGLLGLLMPLVALVVIAWAIVTVWRAVSLPRGTPRVPACERCKYAVADLVGFTCPECGSDLRRVGIVTPAIEATRRGSTATAVLAWTFLWCVGLYFVFFVLVATSGLGFARSATAGINDWTQTLTPIATNAYRSVELTYDSDWQSLAGPMDIALTLNDGSVRRLVLDPGPMDVTGLGAGPTAWNAGVVTTWFTELGMDLTDPGTSAAAAEVGRVIDVTVIAPSTGSSMNLTEHSFAVTSSSFAPPAPFTSGGGVLDSPVFWAASLGAGVLLYVLGIVWIVRRRRRLLRTATG